MLVILFVQFFAVPAIRQGLTIIVLRTVMVINKRFLAACTQVKFLQKKLLHENALNFLGLKKEDYM